MGFSRGIVCDEGDSYNILFGNATLQKLSLIHWQGKPSSILVLVLS